MQVSKEETIITTTTISKPTQITTQISQQLLQVRRSLGSRIDLTLNDVSSRQNLRFRS